MARKLTRKGNGKDRKDLKVLPKAQKQNGKSADDILREAFPPEVNEEEVKEIIVYPKARCVVEGCTRNAVGSSDVSKRHGGDPVVRDNLLRADQIPDWLLAKTKYEPASHPIAYIKLASQGMSEVEIAAEFGVSVGTMRKWAEKFEEFNTAFEVGASMYEAWWLQEGKENLDNRNYNVGLYKFITGNQLGYSDKMESKNLNVTAGVLLVPQQVDQDAWEAKGEEFLNDRG